MSYLGSNKFEFVLSINDHIICQRFFNAKRFNERSLRSMEIKWAVNDIVSMIKLYLKNNAKSYLWEHYNPYLPQTEVIKNDIFEKEDIFKFEIKIDGRTVAGEIFSGNVYPPKVRYDVDIRHLIPRIIIDIQDVFERKNFVTKFADLEL